MTDFIFYDTETTGPSPRYDQILQAGGILTDDDFIEQDTLDIRSRLAAHVVPTAGALKVTGIDPYDIARADHGPYAFAKVLHDTLSAWSGGGATAFTGYNTIRFDEEILRQIFWENLLDPYLSSGKGRMRNDVLTAVRALYARNPDCIALPSHPETGKRNFKLENIAPLNGFAGHAAHDALGDVRATIHMARVVRDTDLALWEHLLSLGNANTARNFIDDEVMFKFLGGKMLDPGSLDCCLIASETQNTKNKSAWNLAYDPLPYLDMGAEAILAEMKKSNTPFRTVKCNKQPAAFPMGWEFLNPVSNDAFTPCADTRVLEERAEMIRSHDGFRAATAEALRLRTESYGAPETLEERIYAGFPSWDDKNRAKRFHTTADWSAGLDVIRAIEKTEMRSLGIRTAYVNAPEALSDTLRQNCAARIREERHTLETDKPWNTVGALMHELDQALAATPDDPELLRIRQWALETYPDARGWTGKADSPAESADGVSAADAAGTSTEAAETAPDQDGKDDRPAPSGVPAPQDPVAPHFLDGLE